MSDMQLAGHPHISNLACRPSWWHRVPILDYEGEALPEIVDLSAVPATPKQKYFLNKIENLEHVKQYVLCVS